jgi:hypothetical protein
MLLPILIKLDYNAWCLLDLNIPLVHVFLARFEPRHFLIPWTGGAFAPLGPFPCPITEEKKWPIAPKPGP